MSTADLSGVVPPSLETGYPVLCSPFYPQTRAGLAEWTGRLGVFPNGSAAARFAEADFPRAAALCVPHAMEAERLLLAAANIGLLTAFDDVVEALDADADRHVRRMTAVVSMEPVPGPMSPLETCVAELYERLRDLLNDGQWTVTTHETRRFFHEILTLARGTLHGPDLPVEQYLDRRALDLGNYVLYPIVEMCLGIDLGPVRGHELLHELHRCHAKAIAIQDDLVSFRKEHGGTHVKNLVLLAHRRGTPMQDAVGEVHRLYRSYLDRFERAARALEAASFPHQAVVDRYTMEMRHFVAGVAGWFEDSCRYSLADTSTWRPTQTAHLTTHTDQPTGPPTQ
ncbi:hypothetical protein [Streptomyces sp. NPDC088789]|uniref:terpene synthase family protein n=1 Tax=Streptomyces sp. NPDC088789 TaxID=3365899 RepID=UPI00382B3398